MKAIKKTKQNKIKHYSIHMTSLGMKLKCRPIVGTQNINEGFFIDRSYEYVSYNKIQLL